MKLTLTILTCLFLSLITYEDLKNKAVPAYFFLLLFAVIIPLALQERPLGKIWISFLLIVCILLLFFGCLLVYFRVKEKRWTNIVDTKLGIGDILFWVAIAPLFTPVSYVLMLLFSLLFSLLAFGIYFWITPARQETAVIPLAGLQALFISLLLITNILFKSSVLQYHLAAITI